MGFLSGMSGGLQAALADPSMMSAAAKAGAPSSGGGGGGFLRGLRRRLHNIDPAMIGALRAAMNGDQSAMMQLYAMRQHQQQQQQQAEAAAQEEGRRAEALQGMGFDKDQISGMRPEDISQLARDRLQPRQFGPEGGSLYNPQTGTYERAPSTRQIGRSIIGFDANSSTPQTLYEGVEPIAVQPGGAVYGMTGQGQIRGSSDAPQSQAPAQGGPVPGQIVNGYRFRGGNPNDRNSWEQVGGAGSAAQTPFNDRYSRTAMAESGGRDFGRNGAPVRSNRGAMYAMQVMPNTAGDPGYGVRPARGNSPAEFNRVGREYIDAMVREFGSEAAGAAAYNFGPGNFRALLRQHPNDWRRHLPPETQDYLRRQGL